MPTEPVHTYNGFTSWPCAIACDGKRLFVSDSGSKFLVHDVESTELLATVTGHSDWIIDLRFDDDTLITAANDHQLRMWDLKTLAPLGVHGEYHHGVGLCTVQWNENRLISCSESWDTMVHVYRF